MGTAIKHPMPGRVKPSFVIFDIRALWRYPCGTTGRQRVNRHAFVLWPSLLDSVVGCE